jgi:hypothetical protein
VAATLEQTAFITGQFDFDNLYDYNTASVLSPATASDLTVSGEAIDYAQSKSSVTSSPRPKKQITQTLSGTNHIRRAAGGDQQQQGKTMDSSDGAADTPGASGRVDKDSKPKRVRTGCLTCRERHLKCDEKKPICINCQKSNRKCKQGVRLNFIDIKCEQPGFIVPPGGDWQIAFQDESREIASEYKGGKARYGPVEHAAVPTDPNAYYYQTAHHMAQPGGHQHLPSIQGILPATSYSEDAHTLAYTQNQHQHGPSHHHHNSHSESAYTGTGSSYEATEQAPTPEAPPREYLDTQEEVLFMQVFVEEVGLWMDSMDPLKHVGSAFILAFRFGC